jgi:hypothetical protein
MLSDRGVTLAATPQEVLMAGLRWARWSPVSGILFVALWLVAFIGFGNDLESNDSNDKILAYYRDRGHQHKDIAIFFFVLAASLAFVWFLSVLRGRLARAEGTAGSWTSAAFGAGLVSAALWIVSMAVFTAPGVATNDTSKFHLDPDTYRITQDIAYAIWFSATTVAAVTVFVTSMLGLRAGVVPKWLAWLGFVAALTFLVAFFFLPFFILLGWVLVVSVVWLIQSIRSAPTAAAQPPA